MILVKRDCSLDFVKGFAALAVVLLHNMPNYYIGSVLWIGQAVPLFLFVSAYLTYGSFERGKTIESYFSKSSMVKMMKRIFKPFLMMTIIQVVIIQIISWGGVNDEGIVALSFLVDGRINYKGLIASGGIGPGSYYPWLYLQAWVFLPVIAIVTTRFSAKTSCTIFFVTCIILELISSLVNVNPAIYRLSFYRYLFLLYLGCIVKRNSISLSKGVVFLAGISAIFLILSNYSDIDFRPFFFNQWKGHNWLGYFYTVFFFLLLKKIYYKYNDKTIVKWLTDLGPMSYEIFLCQMFVYSFVSLNLFQSIKNEILQYSAFVITTTILSLVPVIIYKRCR